MARDHSAHAVARFEDAIAWQQRGDRARADAICAEVIRAQPAHADAWHMRGLLAFQGGRFEEGVGLVRRLLTCAGEAFVSRMAGSLLHAVGLPELITSSLPEYESKALELLREPRRLAGLRARLAENLPRAVLSDTARFTRHLEAAYHAMHERACNGLPPADFSVRA